MTTKTSRLFILLWKRGRVYLMTTLLFLIALEGLGTIYFGLIHGISRKRLIDVYRLDEERGAITWVLDFKPHPFLLYAPENILQLEQNPPATHPTVPRIAILGGSVAYLFGEWDKQTQGFRTALREHIPCLQQNSVEIINLAGGGYKQPQQLIAATLFNKYADYFVNLDGFNEAAAAPYGTKFPTNYPKLTPYFLNLDYKAQTYQHLGNLSRWLFFKGLDNPEKSFKLRKSYGYLLLWRLTRPLFIRIFRICERQFVAANYESQPKEKLSGAIRANLWKESLLQQHLLLKSNQKPHLFYIQPNLHVKNTKPLSPIEETFLRTYPHFSGTGDVMKLEIDSIPELKKREVPIHDLTHLFDNETQTTYSDQVGHLSKLGNKIVADRLAKDISRIFKCLK